MKVSEVMTSDVQTVSADQTAREPLPMLWLFGGGAGLLLFGVLLGWWMHPRPRQLSPQEMEAMTGKLRSWVADGTGAA